MSVLGGKVEKAKIAAFILLTSPGTPYIYYGEEIGMQGRKPDELIRRPMQWSGEPFGGFSTSSPWQELDPTFVEVNVQNQLGAPDSLLSTYQKLITIRASQPALSVGEYLSVDSVNTGVYSFIRQAGSSTLLIVVNLTKNSIIDYALNAETLSTGDAVYVMTDIFSGADGLPLTTQNGGFTEYKPLEQLDPYTGYIFEFVK